MKPLDYAMQIELEGERLYRGFAEKSSNKELKTLFNWLADSEMNHYQTFKNMKTDNIESIEDDVILNDVDNILYKVKEKNNRADFKTHQVDIYSDILNIEKKMADFYEQKAEASRDDKVKEVFYHIAQEEKRHQYIIENLIKFVNNPEIWLKEGKLKEILSYFPL